METNFGVKTLFFFFLTGAYSTIIGWEVEKFYLKLWFSNFKNSEVSRFVSGINYFPKAFPKTYKK